MKSENELAQISDMTLRVVLEDSPIGIAILERATGRRMFVNSALAKIFGAASREEMLIQDIFETWVNPDDLKRAMSLFQDSQSLVNFEAERRRRDGSRWWVLMNTQPLIFEGTEAGIVWHIDITDRRRAEEDLQESEQRYKKIFDFAPFAIYIQDGKAILEANEAAAKIYGYRSPEEMIGIRVIDMIHPDDKSRFLDRLERHQQHGEQLPFIEERRIREDGTEIKIIQSGTRIPQHGGDLILAMSQDITDRKQAEDRLGDAVENIADGFVLFDAEDRVAIWNRRFVEMYPELAGMLSSQPTAEDMFRERHRVGAVGAFDVPSDEYVKWRMQMRHDQGGTPAVHRHSDGRWFRTTERPTTEGGIVAISTDVTELKVRELELSDALRQAEFADRAKSMFLANMSHELRTPLNAISGFSEIIEQEMFGSLGNPHYVEYAHDIRVSGQHLLAIINDILDLSRIEEGEDELDETVSSVSDVIEACLPLVRERAADAQVRIHLEIVRDLPRIFVDVRRMKQIAINLLSNAIKFSEKGGNVTISAGVDNSGALEIIFKDTGIGMRPEDIPKALEPFGQVDSSLARKYEGTGLGLSLVKQLTNAHGGQLRIDSELSVGTTVRVFLPPERLVTTGVHGTNRVGSS